MFLESNSTVYCNADRKMKTSRSSWLYIAIMILASYSTLFSGIWLYLACARPRYGHRITTGGQLSFSTASTLFAAFAKTIELSYVAVFVAFLGQVLSRRALVLKSKGITIAEMTMRLWITQPGTMFTHWETVRYAALSFLGGLCILATLMAMLYTTASDTLGQSQSLRVLDNFLRSIVQILSHGSIPSPRQTSILSLSKDFPSKKSQKWSNSTLSL